MAENANRVDKRQVLGGLIRHPRQGVGASADTTTNATLTGKRYIYGY